MPTYTYRCGKCGHEFDHRQSFSDPFLTICPNCEAEALHRVYKPVGVVFKGSGFYATDNRSPSGLNGKPKSGETEKTTSESSTSKSKSTESKVAESA